MKALDYFNGLDRAAIQTLEAEAVADPIVRTCIEKGAVVLMSELLEVLEETSEAPKEARIEAIVDHLERHCIRGFALGFGYSRLLHEQAAFLADAAVSTARGGH